MHSPTTYPPPESLPVSYGMLREGDQYAGTIFAGMSQDEIRRRKYYNICSLSYAMVRALGLLDWVRRESELLNLPLPLALHDGDTEAIPQYDYEQMEQPALLLFHDDPA